MALQLTMTLAGTSGNKNAVEVASVIAPPIANQIQVVITDTVDVFRRVEIIAGWKWLWQGIRERQFDAGFAGVAVFYTSCPLNDLTTPARKTSDDPVIMVAGDIAITINGSLINLDTASMKGVVGETAFQQLRDFAKELPTWDV